MVRHVENGHVSRVQSRALSYADESSACEIFLGTFTYAHNILQSDQTVLEGTYLFIYLFQFNSRHKAHEKKEKYKRKYRIN